MLTQRIGVKNKCLSLALAFFLMLAWLPTAARAQFSIVVSPVTALPGDTSVSVFGSLTNGGTTPIDLDNASFDLATGPATADLTTAIISSDYLIPATLDAGQDYSGALFTVDIDPSAPLGQYTGNFPISYGGQLMTPTVFFTLGTTTPVPEAGSLPLLALGIIL